MRSFDTAIIHIRRSPYQSLSAVLIMFLTLLLSGVFLIATVSSAVILQYFESKPQITVFFSDKSKEADVVNLKKTLQDTGVVESLTYVSKDDALQIYQEQNKDDPLLLEMVTADILPASLEVSAIDPTYLVQLVNVINKSDGIEEVVYQKDVIDSLIAWANAIRLTGGVIAGLLVFF